MRSNIKDYLKKEIIITDGAFGTYFSMICPDGMFPEKANTEASDKELLASGVMAASSPLINFFLNLGLNLVVIVGAYRVNAGLT